MKRRNKSANPKEGNLLAIRDACLKLEGVTEGLSPFFPAVGRYMHACIDEIYRTLYILEDPLARNLGRLSGESQPGWEEVDAAIGQELRKERLENMTKKKIKK